MRTKRILNLSVLFLKIVKKNKLNNLIIFKNHLKSFKKKKRYKKKPPQPMSKNFTQKKIKNIPFSKKKKKINTKKKK